MTEPAAQPKRPTSLLIWLIVSQLLAVGSLFLWVIGAAFSVMAFDEGSSLEAWRFVILVWAYPLFPLLMAIGAWVAYGFRKNRLSALLTGLTITPPILFILFIWIEDLIRGF